MAFSLSCNRSLTVMVWWRPLKLQICKLYCIRSKVIAVYIFVSLAQRSLSTFKLIYGCYSIKTRCGATLNFVLKYWFGTCLFYIWKAVNLKLIQTDCSWRHGSKWDLKQLHSVWNAWAHCWFKINLLCSMAKLSYTYWLILKTFNCYFSLHQRQAFYFANTFNIK